MNVGGRCAWAASEPNLSYHDAEWGKPVHDDHMLFEMLILEGAQAGLSWTTILNRRSGYRRAFEGFDPAIVARYGDEDKARLLTDAGIIRNRAKIDATVLNAQGFLRIQEDFGSFESYIWRFVDGTPVVNGWKNISDLPASSPLSDRVSKDLKARGFKFVGTTICYSFLQACGLVNDHMVNCFRYRELLS